MNYQTLARLVAATLICAGSAGAEPVELGPRPMFLVDQLPDGALKTQLASCAGQDVSPSLFSISHRGAPLMFPEHTRQGYVAAARMGAGIIECDVTFTADKELVCRHSQNDLHTTTNILGTELAAKCSVPFEPASDGNKAKAECRTSDLTLAEFRTLNGKMDAADRSATNAQDYMNATANWRTDLYAGDATLMTHAESIALFKSLGVKFTPELKSPAVDMPYQGFTQQDYAQKLIDEYKAAGVPPGDVFAQSFNLDDILYWIKAEPEFGAQAVYLDASYRIDGWSPAHPGTWTRSMAELKGLGVNYIAPPMWVLVRLEGDTMVPSEYAIQARAAGLNIITWTLERSGPLTSSGGWYYQTVKPVINSDADALEMLEVLAKDVGVKGVFSDWPATVSFYASCMGLD